MIKFITMTFIVEMAVIAGLCGAIILGPILVIQGRINIF